MNGRITMDTSTYLMLNDSQHEIMDRITTTPEIDGSTADLVIGSTASNITGELNNDPWLSGLTMFVIYNSVRFIQIIIGIFGNVLTLIIVPKLEQVNNGHILIFNLCISDLFTCLMWPVNLSVNLSLTHYPTFWPKLCVVKEVLTIYSYSCSLLTYLVIAIDRYLAVCWELRYKVYITRKKIYFTIALVWVYNAFMSIFAWAYFGATFDELDKLQRCNITNVFGIRGYYYIILPHMISVAIGMLICYVSIMVKMKRRDRKMASMYEGHSGYDKEKSMLASRVTRTLTLVLGIFIAVYFPAVVMHALDAFIKTKVVYILVDVSALVFFLNNLVNPCVYYYKMPEFKKLYRAMLRL